MLLRKKKIEDTSFCFEISIAELGQKSENRTFRPVTCRYRFRLYFDELWTAHNCGK